MIALAKLQDRAESEWTDKAIRGRHPADWFILAALQTTTARLAAETLALQRRAIAVVAQLAGMRRAA